jgi:hypothetical protein
MFPLDKSEKTGEYEFMVGEDRCLGRKEPVEWVIGEWFTDQGLAPFEEMDERFRVVTQYPRLEEAGIGRPDVQKMFRMACYDLDTFRQFVFQTTFLERFDLDPDTVARIKTDDLILLELALQWVRYGLVCGDVLPLKKAPKDSRGKGQKGKPKKRSDPP